MTDGDLAGTRATAIEEFDTRADLEAFLTTQPHDKEAQTTTIARTFAPFGPFTVVGVVTAKTL